MMAVDGRRLVRAGLLTLAAFLLVGGGFGFAVAASPGSSDLLIPSPRPGDRAVYRVTQDVADSNVGDIGLDEVVYEWLPETTILDASFVPHPVQPLQATYVFGQGRDWETHRVIITSYDPATGLPIHQASETQSTAPQYVLPGALGPVGQQVVGTALGTQPPIENSYLAESFGEALGPPCGQRFPAPAGHALDLGRCGWPGHAQLFAPTGWSSLSTGRAFGYEAQADAGLQVWYQSGTPFPLRVVASMAELVNPWAVGRLFTLDRVAWARGAADYEMHAPVMPGVPVDRVRLVPDLMLDDAGLDPDLPLERAYKAAYDAPQTSARTGIRPTDPYQPRPTVPEWLADHPEGYLAVAEHFLDKGWSQQYPGWALLWTDGSSWIGKIVVNDSSIGDEAHISLPEQLPKRITVADWRLPDDVASAWIAAFPPPDRLPADMPSLAAVAKQFHAFVSPADLSHYGFRVHCGEACLSGAPAQAHVYVGHTNSSFSPSTSATGGSATTESLTIGGNGFTVTRSRYTREATPVLGLGAPSEKETPLAPALGSSAGHWEMPSTPAATGISLVALLAGALYYFWPALKAMPAIGLFSRVKDGAVLDHPTRRRIFDAIQAEPGIHFMALTRKAAVSRGGLAHHIDKLVSADLVVVRKTAGYTCYFAKGATHRHIADAAPALRSGGSRAVFDAVCAEPGISCRELARRLGRSPSTVSYHLKRLEGAGLVFGAGNGVKLSPLGELAASA